MNDTIKKIKSLGEAWDLESIANSIRNPYSRSVMVDLIKLSNDLIEELESKNASIESLQQSSLSYQKVIEEQLKEIGGLEDKIAAVGGEVSDIYKSLPLATEKLKRLQDEHKAMKEALEWYANYSEEYSRKYYFGLIKSDVGERARSVLSSLKEESE